MRGAITRGLRCGQCLVVMSITGPVVLGAQDRRDSLIATAKEEFDAAKRIQLLITALDPLHGAPSGAWGDGVQLLAQTFLEEGQASVASLWLRWAIRLHPELQPDTIQFPPQVTTAFQVARQFVNQTKTAGDSLTTTTWQWPAVGSDRDAGRIQIDSAAGLPLQVSLDGAAPLGPGIAQVAPGSHETIAATAGHDTIRVTREVLPGATMVLQFRPRAAQIAARPPAVPPPSSVAPRRKGFPWVWAALGAAGAATAVVLLAGGENPPTTGGIIITFP